jgi:hypothetical protein
LPEEGAATEVAGAARHAAAEAAADAMVAEAVRAVAEAAGAEGAEGAARDSVCRLGASAFVAEQKGGLSGCPSFCPSRQIGGIRLPRVRLVQQMAHNKEPQADRLGAP